MSSIPSESALQAVGVRQQVAANNVANINTQDFQSSRVTLEEMGDRQGVAVQSVEQSAQDTVHIENARRDAEQDPEQAERLQQSNTDLAAESVQMLENQNSYAANASMIQAEDELQGQIVNRLA